MKGDDENWCGVGTVTKKLVQRLEELERKGQVEAIQTALLTSARILRTVLKT